MKRMLGCLGLLAALACAPRPEIPTADLGKDCQGDNDCAEGQTCHAWAHPSCDNAQCQTCEIVCEADSDCPAGFHCNLPPLLPDTAVNTCAQD